MRREGRRGEPGRGGCEPGGIGMDGAAVKAGTPAGMRLGRRPAVAVRVRDVVFEVRGAAQGEQEQRARGESGERSAPAARIAEPEPEHAGDYHGGPRAGTSAACGRGAQTEAATSVQCQECAIGARTRGAHEAGPGTRRRRWRCGSVAGSLAPFPSGPRSGGPMHHAATMALRPRRTPAPARAHA